MHIVLLKGLAVFAATWIATVSWAGDAMQGEVHFRLHCATCHGLSGDGGGPMAGVLLVPPLDLTVLEAGNDGVFPTQRVVMRIDGRDPLVSHGSSMPVYGPFFQQDGDVALKAETGQPILTSAPIADLVAYLIQIQEPE